MMTERKDKTCEFDTDILREAARVIQGHSDFTAPTDTPNEITSLLEELRSMETGGPSASGRSMDAA
jgi:hypothetical protein